MKHKNMTHSYIACVAGKSGGHIIPCLTYARSIKKNNQEILFFSNNSPLDYALLKNQPDIAHHQAYPLTLNRGFLGIITSTILFVTTTINSYKTLKKYRPTHIVSTGGLISVPVFIAGWFLNIPCIFFELNAIPGKAARVCSFFASKIHVCFSAAASYFPARKTIKRPYPLQSSIRNALLTKKNNLQEKKTVLILGGSQGSVFLNNCIKMLVTAYPTIAAHIHIIHQTGSNDLTDWPMWYAQHAIHAEVFSFNPDLVSYYQQADIIIARAGAGTLFEIMQFKKKCIIIPLETKYTDHQLNNAQAIAQEYPHLCTVIREKDFNNNIHRLYEKITHVDNAKE